MSKEIQVEKDVYFIPKEKLYSIRLVTKEPYGEFYPRTIYITAIFHKKLDKALKMAWNEFYASKAYQDNQDAFYRSKQTETVSVTA